MNLSRATEVLAAAIFLTAYPALRGSKIVPTAAPAAKSPQTLAGPAEIYPDAMMTPGDTNPAITQENIGQNICKKGWSTDSVRPPTSVTNKIKKDTMAAYGFSGAGDYELDHLISLQNGGCPKCVTNLWPEAYGDAAHPMTHGKRSTFNKSHAHSTGILPGAIEKDLVENHIHDEICRDIPNARIGLRWSYPPTVRIRVEARPANFDHRLVCLLPEHDGWRQALPVALPSMALQFHVQISKLSLTVGRER